MHKKILYKNIINNLIYSYSFRHNLNKFLRYSYYKKMQSLRLLEIKGDYASLKGFDDLRCIFVHIPKVAGVSINKALFGNLGGGHRAILDYSLIFGKNEFKSYYKFTFVRNPWDRLLSAYLFLKEGGLHKNDANWSEKELSGLSNFDEFVKNWVNKINIEKGIHFKPQYKFITINGKIAVDDVYKVENINLDFEKICGKLNVQNRLQFLNKTKSKTKNYRNYYNDETKKIVEKVYKKDIKLFNYQF